MLQLYLVMDKVKIMLHQEFLGKFLEKSPNLQVSTKLAAADTKSEKLIRSSVTNSLRKLQIETIEVLYLHDESVLLQENGQQVFSKLQNKNREDLNGAFS